MLGSRFNQHSFAKVPDVAMARSQFDRSHTRKDAFNFDYLIPIFLDEVLPGDTYNLNVNTFMRLATQVVPVMDNMYVDFFFFFCPNRLLWSNWEKFCGAQDNPGDSTSFVIPTLAAFGANAPAVDTIYDKMGLPTNVAGAWTCGNALPFRMYNLLWNQWFRDQNLQNSVTVHTDNGPDPIADYTLLKRGKRHDYFTSCLPWPQKGTAQALPLGTSAPIVTNSQAIKLNVGSADRNLVAEATDNKLYVDGSALGGATAAYFGTQTGLVADLTNATAATINSLRQAFQIQSLLELDARGGTRYVEILQAHFRVTSPDFRLQRVEFLGGGESPINSHPVPQTSATSGSNYQGSLASFATSATNGGRIGFTKSFVEHGYVMGIACARADITYQQGLHRMWTRSTRYDFFWPKLQELGEQAVLNSEIYCAGAGGTDSTVFGYQERFAEMRYKPSQICGQFRSTYSAPLDQWHLAEKYASVPALNSTFIQQNTPITRVIANSSEVHLKADMWFSLKCARPMMTYSVPLSLGKF